MSETTQDDNVWAELEESAAEPEKQQAHGQESHQQDFEDSLGDAQDIEDAREIFAKPKPSKISVYLAAGALGLAGLGLGGFVLSKAFGGRNHVQPASALEMAPSDSKPISPMAPLSASSAVPGGSIGGSADTAEAPSAIASAPAAAVVTKEPEAVVPTTTKVVESVPPVAPAPATSVKVNDPIPPVLPAYAAPQAAVKKKPEATSFQSSVGKSCPCTDDAKPAVQRTVQRKAAVVSHPVVAEHKKFSKAKGAKPNQAEPSKVEVAHEPASEEVVIEAKPKLQTGGDLGGFKILSFAPVAGAHPMAYLKYLGEKTVIVREGELLPDGSRVTKIDVTGRNIVTTNGVLR